VVESYSDDARGTMVEDAARGGYFSEVMLNPVVAIRDPEKKDEALRLHSRAHDLCFIANSCNFPVRHHAKVLVQQL